MPLEQVLLHIAFVAYAASGFVALAALARREPREGAMLALLAAGVLLHTAAIAVRWERVGHGPFITMYDVLSSNIWSLSLAFGLAAWRWRPVRAAAAAVMPVLFMMMAWLLATGPQTGHLPATYATVWLYIHVGLGKVFLGCVFVAVGLSGLVLLRTLGMASPRLAALPSDTRLERLAFRFMAVGFVFESLMLLAGAVWAQDAWGRYWAWDPLETWAFVTWVSLAAFLHARVALRVTPVGGAAMVIAVFTLAFLTFFGVPFVSTAPHQGAL